VNGREDERGRGRRRRDGERRRKGWGERSEERVVMGWGTIRGHAGKGGAEGGGSRRGVEEEV